MSTIEDANRLGIERVNAAMAKPPPKRDLTDADLSAMRNLIRRGVKADVVARAFGTTLLIALAVAESVAEEKVLDRIIDSSPLVLHGPGGAFQGEPEWAVNLRRSVQIEEEKRDVRLLPPGCEP